MTSTPLELESFETSTEARPLESADYLRGVQDGLDQAQSSASMRQAHALAEVAATLADMSFGFVEARSYVLGSIEPILAQVAEAVIPTVLQETFAQHLLAVIHEELGDASAGAITLDVAAEQIELLEAVLPAHFTVQSDPALAPGQAVIRQSKHDVLLDLPGLGETLRQALLGLETIERTRSHG